MTTKEKLCKKKKSPPKIPGKRRNVLLIFSDNKVFQSMKTVTHIETHVCDGGVKMSRSELVKKVS